MEPRSSNWTYLSNHAHVVIYVADHPEARLRDVAEAVGITERAVLSIVTDLEHEGVITRTRNGRRNHYDVHVDARFRHPMEQACRIEDLLAMVHRANDRIGTAGNGTIPTD